MVLRIGPRSSGSLATMVCKSRKKGLNWSEVPVSFCSCALTLSHSTGREMSVPSMSKTQYFAFGFAKGLERALTNCESSLAGDD
jgi:hypothetical protein